ncbi:copper resistance CopC family protein [Sphaerisporangium sp. B11E5]|uniref:copper resistance CopC family protein n=1 Tax=Sphaerisporangium sp. B11E5 TaxID=3153563 RepID=UPI00325F8420
MRRLLTVLLVACAALATVVAPAQAHNVLTGSDPKDGARVPAVPERATLTFDQPVRPEFAKLALTRPGGTAVQLPALEVRGTKVIGTLPSGPPGAYALGYQIVSNDGHPVTGTIRFTVTSPPPSPAPDGTASTAPADPASTASGGPAGGGPGDPAGTSPGPGGGAPGDPAGAAPGNPAGGAPGDPVGGVAASAVPQSGGGSWVWGLLVVALVVSGLGIVVVVRRPRMGGGQSA